MNSAECDRLVYETVSDLTRTPGARMSWGPKKCVPAMPYFTYERRRGGEMYADDANHAILPRYRVTLYCEDPDDAMEEAYCKAVATLGPYSRSWEYDDEHEAYVTHFDFTLAGRH